jgi:hypothetical protein
MVMVHVVKGRQRSAYTPAPQSSLRPTLDLDSSGGFKGTNEPPFWAAPSIMIVSRRQPFTRGGRVWYGIVTRVVLFPRNPGEHEYANLWLPRDANVVYVPHPFSILVLHAFRAVSAPPHCVSTRKNHHSAWYKLHSSRTTRVRAPYQTLPPLVKGWRRETSIMKYWW